MPSTVEQLSPSRVKITVEVPFADLKPSMDKAYSQIAKQVNIPGFRTGKVPPMVIDQRFGRGVVLQEALNDALPDFYGQAVQDNALAPLAQPDIEVTKLEDGDLIEFTAEVDVRPDFDLPDFDSVAITVDALDVPDTLIEEQLTILRERFGQLNPVERPAADGDVVVISLVASKDGEPLEDATADDLSYKVGSGGMLDGLDEAVLGLSAGESTTFTSELVGGPLKGEQSEVEVTVTKVQEQELPEVDDEFAQMASEFDTMEEMRADLVVRLTQMARLEQASGARDAVLEAVIAGLNIDVPEEIIKSEILARKQQIESQLGEAELSLEQYLAESEDENKTPEDFWADVEKRSGDALKAQMLLDKLADDREIGVDQNDLTQHVIAKAQHQNSDPQEVAKHMMEHNHLTEYMTEIRRGKALALVVESATVTDSAGEPVELTNLRPDGSIGDPAAEQDSAAGEAGQEADAGQESVAAAEEETVQA